MPLPFLFFFFNDTATTEIYTLSLHDALPIFGGVRGDDTAGLAFGDVGDGLDVTDLGGVRFGRHRSKDRKSTRLNSSHVEISYAVFCLKKKKKKRINKIK